MTTVNRSTKSKNKRPPRGRYMDAKDKVLLIGLAKKYEDIILNRNVDQSTNQKKNLAWRYIANEFNAKSTKKKTAEQLKNIYRNKRTAMCKAIATISPEAMAQYDTYLSQDQSVQPSKYARNPINHYENYSYDEVELSSTEQSLECSLEEAQTDRYETFSVCDSPEPNTSTQSTETNLQLFADARQTNGSFSHIKDNDETLKEPEESNSPQPISNGTKKLSTSKELKNILYEEYIKVGKLKQKLLESKIRFYEEKTRLLSTQSISKN